jgi:threonine dehydratase
VGDEPFRIVSGHLDGLIRVNTDEICAAILDLFEDTRVLAEPAGALAVAGLKKWVRDGGGESGNDPARGALVAIQSGANVHFHRLRHISERAELGEQRESIFAVTIPEQPGSFLKLCTALGERGITEFNYRYSGPGDAHVFVGVQLSRGSPERDEIVAQLRDRHFDVLDLSDNELALVHTRHMVGGRTRDLHDERLLRFEFPERPGAFRRFLQLMSPSWNITLFHYRNHGSALGRVLAGIQVPPGEDEAFRSYLDTLGYFWVEESQNPAYRLFL